MLTAGYSGLNRAWKQNGAGTRTYFLCDGSNPVCELDSSGNVIAANAFGPTGLVSRYSGTSSTFYQYDPEGNPTLRLSSTGTTIGSGVFDPYSGYHGSVGYYSDQETGLQLLGARYYDPGTGRFLTRDPAGYMGGPNPYAYCMGNSVGTTDPMGLDSSATGQQSPTLFDNNSDGLHTLNNYLHSNDSPLIQLLNFTDPDPVSIASGLEDSFNKALDGGYGLATGKGSTLQNAWDLAFNVAILALTAIDDGCNGGCFVAGTPVQMADKSTTTIENVHDNDKIISRDPATGKTEIKTVLNTTVHQVHDLVVLHFASKKDGKEIDTVTTTPVHPFYVAGKGFVLAGQLAVG